MGAPRPYAWSTRPAPLCLVLGLLLPSGCDKLPGGSDEAKDEPTQDAEAPAKTDEQVEVEVEAKAEDDAAEPTTQETKAAEDEAAKKAAEEEAAKKATEDEAAKKAAEEEAAKSRPVALSEMAVKTMGGMFGGTGMLEVTAKATINQTLGSSTYVHIKSRCKQDDLLIADVGYLNADYTKPLEQYAVGEVADVKGNVYTQGLKSALSPCQFELRVGGLGGGLSIPVGEACWDGSKVTEGPCDPALVPIAMSGATVPMEVHRLDVERGGGIGGSKGLDLQYLLKIREPQDNSVRITFKTACRVDGKTFADLGQANLSAGPFAYEAGETVARAANLYWSNAFELTESPNDCDITTSLWKTKAGTYGEYEELRLQDSCFKDDKLRPGRCDPSVPPPPAAAALVAESVTVDEVRIELAEPYGASGKFQLKVQADVTLAQPVTNNDGVTAKVSCKAGAENRVESAYLFGTELHYLLPGETTRMTGNAFGSHPLETKPKSCKVEFFGGPRFSPSGAEGVDLGKFCLKKDKVNKGGKC
ncbi:MAG: hypothetical protein AB1Z98_05575 [Nannocystaceae bacterium]